MIQGKLTQILVALDGRLVGMITHADLIRPMVRAE
jgi:hypothetical protein